MSSSAVISECGRYRYELGRRWGEGLTAVFVMFNPSTADAEQDDPTIRRCIGFAESWGCGALRVVNLFALRATDPRELRDAMDPIGNENDGYIRRACARRDVCVVVAAWGASLQRWPVAKRRRFAVERMLPADAVCLARTGDGIPRHPLFVKGDVERVPLRG